MSEQKWQYFAFMEGALWGLVIGLVVGSAGVLY